MNAATRSRMAQAGNAVVLVALGACALWLAGLQPWPWQSAPPDDGRVGAAATAVVAYVLLVAWTWWPRRERGAHAGAYGAPSATLVAYASQTGFAQALAERTAAALRDADVPADLVDLGRLDATRLASASRLLAVASTTGEGDPPDHVLRFVRETMGATHGFAGLEYAVLALGDRNYANYCAFGHQLEQWLRQAGATPLFDLVEVDNGDTGALRHWQHHLAVLAGAPELPDWAPAEYQPWQLAERRHLNPGSVGGAVFHLSLSPPAGVAMAWRAGDIAEVGPRNAPARVEALLASLGLDGGSRVRFAGGDATLSDALSRAHLPDAASVAGQTAVALASRLEPLPHREYSISSLPADGRLEFLLRRMLHPDGTPGLASGWLCEHARVGDGIDLRVRANPGFHAPDPSRPMVLVGNGTGIGGLRAHLKQRIADGARRNWLLFGERHAACDLFHGEELDAWLRDGWLERVDLAFSRDTGVAGAEDPAGVDATKMIHHHGYVQDALRAQASRLREWLEAGAAVYVCGSLAGMAPGVDAVLREVVGTEALEAMAANGRYRRDVY